MEETIDTLSISIESESKNSGKKIDELIEKLKDLDTTIQSSKFSKLITNIKETTDAINGLTSTFQKLNNIDLSKAINNVNKLKEASKGTSISNNTTQPSSSPSSNDGGEIKEPKTEGFLSKMQKLGSTVNQVLGKINSAALDGLAYSFEKAANGASKLAKGGILLAASGIKKVGNFAKNTTKALLDIGSKSISSSTKMAKAFGSSMISKIKQFSLSLLGTRTAFTAVRKAMSEYLNYDSQLSKTIQNDWAVLGSLMAPILEQVIALFSKAVSYINAFVQALTGINLVARANKKALDSQTASAKSALGSLAGFDDLNVVTFDSGTSSGTSELTTESIDTSMIDELTSKLKDGDWYNLGLEVGQKLTDGLSSIDFTTILDKATEFGTKFSDLFEGLANGIDWNTLGSSIGNGIETAINFVYAFLTNTDWSTLGVNLGQGILSTIEQIDFEKVGTILMGKFTSALSILTGVVTTPGIWEEIGTSISDMFNGAWKSIKWGDLAVTISEGIKGLATSITTALQGVDWQQVGNDIATFLANIDWAGIISSLSETLGTLAGAIGNLLVGLLEDGWESVKDYFGEYISDAGGDVVAGLLNGITDALSTIGQWIVDNIFTPFINGFKSIFGIHSPSTVMAEMGGYIIDGLKEGLSNIWDKVKEIFENLKTNISNKFTEIKDNIGNTIDTIKTKASEKFNSIKDGLVNIVNTIKTKVTDKFTSLKTSIVNTFTSVKNSMTSIWNGIWSTIKGVINKIIEGVEKLCNTVIGGLNKIIKPLTDVGNTILSAIGIDDFHFDVIADVSLPRLATGTNRIPKEGPYYLHKNEAVVPEKYNPAVNNQNYSEANKETVNAIYTLIDTVKNMETQQTINIGNKKLYEGTISYINHKNTINGTNVINLK